MSRYVLKVSNFPVLDGQIRVEHCSANNSPVFFLFLSARPESFVPLKVVTVRF